MTWPDFQQPTMRAETSEQPCDEDRISELPCDILIHVLSFLTLKDAVRTSILSKLWRNIWLSGNRLLLNFDAEEMLIKEEDILPEALNLPYRERDMFVDLPGLQRKFVERVNNELRSCHEAKVVDKFMVRFEVDVTFENDINNWLEFAFARKVQILELDMLIDCHTFACSLYAYGFPNRIVDLISNESSKESPPLPEDYLTCQNNRILGLHDFDSLRSLSLSCVGVSGEVISFFLKKCRNLERVKVCKSNNLIDLEVCGTFPALKYLEICHCRKQKNITVCDTNLVSLKLNKVPILENNPKLVEVCIASDPSHFFGSILPLLNSGSLSRLQALTLDVSCFKAVEVAGHVKNVPQLTMLKQLTLNVKQGRRWITKDLMLLSTSLLSLSPILEKFILQFVRRNTLRMEGRQLVKCPKLPLLYLKMVEFRGYYGCEAEDELIMFFVENAICLETIIIDPCGMKPQPRLRDMTEEKESLKRANKLKEKIPSSIKFTTKESTMQEYLTW